VPRIAIVTGAGRSGVGAAAAVRLAGAGLDIALLDPDVSDCANTVRRITALGRRAVAVGTDITDAASVDHALGEVCDALGDPGVLVNVIDAAAPGPLSDLSELDWYASTAAQLRWVFLVSRAVVDPMIRNMWGRIITIAATTDPDGHGNVTMRTGLAGFTRTVAAELGPYGITSNVISPSVDDPDRVSAVLPFLVSDEAGAVSGQIVHIGSCA
jgi:3-oxoacyl-[acyl-carrier protein] reductase